MTTKGHSRVLAMAAAAGLCLAMALPAIAAAASVTFGTPTATSKFGTGIDFSQPYSGSFASAGIAITFPGDPGPSVTPVDSSSSGAMRYQLDTSGGGVTPFTPIRAYFQATMSDGSVVKGPEITVVYADDRFTWQSVTSGLLTIHWFQGSSGFAQQLLSYGTKGLDKSAKFFGITETNAINFYVYPSQQAFAAGLSVPETIGGQAEPFSRTCFALIAPNDLGYASSVVPHELTHIVFDDVVRNPYHSPPRWLNEGLAVLPVLCGGRVGGRLHGPHIRPAGSPEARPGLRRCRYGRRGLPGGVRGVRGRVRQGLDGQQRRLRPDAVRTATRPDGSVASRMDEHGRRNRVRRHAAAGRRPARLPARAAVAAPLRRPTTPRRTCFSSRWPLPAWAHCFSSRPGI
jgi:hypothetical protein